MKRSLYTYTLNSLLFALVARGFRRGIVRKYITGESIDPFSEPLILPLPR